MSTAVLSLGSNLGDRLGELQRAVDGLGPAVRAVSGVYETAPWGDPDQPDYLNAAVLVDDPDAGALDWLRRAQALEDVAGRVRDPARRYGPRSLDVDVIAVWSPSAGAVFSDSPELTVPHPRAHLRVFVLRPWLDLQADAVLPGHGPIGALLSREPIGGDVTDVRARPDLRLKSH